MDDQEPRYTPGQIFCGIQQIYKDVCGTKAPCDLDARIDEYMKADGTWDELDFADFAYRLEEVFGYTCPPKEFMQEVFGYTDGMDVTAWEQSVAPTVTFRRMAEFIRQRVGHISLAPQTILGPPSKSAGVFVGMEEIAQGLGFTVRKFGPGTAILHRLRGPRLLQFYRRLRWMSENRIPPLRTTALTVLRAVALGLAALFFVASLILFVTVLISWEAKFVACTGICLGAFVAALIVARGINWLDNRLPRGVRTFRDLAELVAKEGN